ncbi:MAG: hypothetical protein ABIA12_01905 [Candidatus Aenigmatarchaeota archaeon]
MVGFEDLLLTGMELGVFDFFLPFVLSFAIIYGILEKANIFGTERVGRNVNLIVSVVLSLFIIGYTPVGVTLAAFFGSMFTGTIMIVVTLLGTMMVLYVLGALAGIQIPGKQSGKWNAVLILITVLLAGAVFVYSGGMSILGQLDIPGVGTQIPIPAMPSISISTNDAVVLGGFILLIVTIVWLTHEEKPKP